MRNSCKMWALGLTLGMLSGVAWGKSLGRLSDDAVNAEMIAPSIEDHASYFSTRPDDVSDAAQKKADKLIKDWNAGKLSMLAAHPGSAAKGLNLQGVESAVVFYAISNNFDWVDQFIKRIARQGQSATHIFAYFILAEDTVDELVFEQHFAKEYNQDNVTSMFSKHREDEDTEKLNDGVAKVKETFVMMEAAFEEQGQTLPAYSPGMDIHFLQEYEYIFHSWSNAQLKTFCHYLELKASGKTNEALRDCCLDFICNFFGVVGCSIEDLQKIKLYPNVINNAEYKKMTGFGAKNRGSKREKKIPRSKFSPGGQVEESRKELEERLGRELEAELEDCRKNRKKKSAKKTAAKKSAKKTAAKKSAKKTATKKSAPTNTKKKGGFGSRSRRR